MQKLLIVDDEVDIREFAKRFFEKRGINVLTAKGGLEAIGLIEKENPNLVLLDVNMEEITGIEVLRKLRQKNNSVKVIMVTGMEDEKTVTETKALGVLDFIHKPLVLEELEKIVLAQLKG